MTGQQEEKDPDSMTQVRRAFMEKGGSRSAWNLGIWAERLGRVTWAERVGKGRVAFLQEQVTSWKGEGRTVTHGKTSNFLEG